jgi:hypothetical protein
MTSEELRQLIPGYLSGQITSAEKSMFEGQLKKNPELGIEVEELRSLWEELGTLSEERPSPAMRAHFYQKLNDMRNGRSRSLLGGFAWWKPGLPGLVRQITLALALFCVGMFAGRVNTSGRASTEQVTQLQTQVQTLRRTVALSLLERQSATSRLEGVSWGAQVDRPDSELLSVLVNTLNHDPNINVRLSALDALEKFANDSNIRKTLIDSIPRQDSPLVQIALIDALVHMRDNSAAGEFRKLTSDADVNAAVRQRAQWGLQKLSF